MNNKDHSNWVRLVGYVIWPLLCIIFVILYHSEIGDILKNLAKVEKFQFGVFEFERRIAIQEATAVSPENTYAVVKAFKAFQDAVMQGKIRELEKYFSRTYPNREEDIEEWRKQSGKKISIHVKAVERHGDLIRADIKVAIEEIEREESVTLIEEDKIWKFLK